MGQLHQMNDEAGLWKYLSRVMGPHWEAQRHEDKHSTGIPDVSYATEHHGWIELKCVQVRDTSRTVKIRHFTAAQRTWIKRFGPRGGHAWVLVQVNKHYLLFSWYSVDRIGHMNLSEMIKESSAWWENSIDPQTMLKALGRHDRWPVPTGPQG